MCMIQIWNEMSVQQILGTKQQRYMQWGRNSPLQNYSRASLASTALGA